jgi:internalin A
MNGLRPFVLLSALLAGCGGPKPVDTPRSRLEKFGIVKSGGLNGEWQNFTATLGETPTDATWNDLGQADGLTSLRLTGRWMTDADFERMGKLKGLQWLEVDRANDLTDRGLAALSGLDQLFSLRVFNTQLNAKAAAELRKLPLLRHVLLRECGITDAGVRELAAIPTLEELTLLDNPDVGDAGVKLLAQRPGLTRLSLEGTRITDQGLAELRGLTKLESLNLEGTAITDRGLEYVRGFKSLYSLDLSNTAVTDAGLDLLRGCENLGMLFLHDTKVTEEGVKRLSAALPGCHVLD